MIIGFKKCRFKHLCILLSGVILLLISSIISYAFYEVAPLKSGYITQSRLMLKRKQANESLKLKQSFISISELSPMTIKAVLFNEDPEFINHNGVSFEDVIRAIKKNIRLKTIKFGASTITQQVAKNMFLDSKRTFLRKAHELLYTLALETLLSKKRILEIYVNIAEWGPGIFGIEEAARYWFNKSSKDLSRTQAIALCYIIPCPLKENPLAFDELQKASFILADYYLQQDRVILWKDIHEMLKQ